MPSLSTRPHVRHWYLRRGVNCKNGRSKMEVQCAFYHVCMWKCFLVMLKVQTPILIAFMTKADGGSTSPGSRACSFFCSARASRRHE
jgi:hypothetical protein